MALICDTGPLYASIDRSDKDHRVCAKLLVDADEELLVPAPVLVELEWLVSSRLGPTVFDSVFESIEDGTLQVEPILEADYARAHGSSVGATRSSSLASSTQRSSRSPSASANRRSPRSIIVTSGW